MRHIAFYIITFGQDKFRRFRRYFLLELSHDIIFKPVR